MRYDPDSAQNLQLTYKDIYFADEVHPCFFEALGGKYESKRGSTRFLFQRKAAQRARALYCTPSRGSSPLENIYTTRVCEVNSLAAELEFVACSPVSR